MLSSAAAWVGAYFTVVNTQIKWTENEIVAEAKAHPERFSPNVILRGVFQEMILPNIAFIGGGGEVAYWLELKKVFEACAIPYPVLVLRNSFMLVNKKQLTIAHTLGFTPAELFAPLDELMNKLVTRNKDVQLTLTNEKNVLHKVYNDIENTSAKIDQSLLQHVKALEVQHIKMLELLEKKMLRAEKKKYAAQQRQLQKLKDHLFPGGSLQERVDNFSFYYATYGKSWFKILYDASGTLEQEFCICITS